MPNLEANKLVFYSFMGARQKMWNIWVSNRRLYYGTASSMGMMLVLVLLASVSRGQNMIWIQVYVVYTVDCIVAEEH